jgi:hypothetical protein
MSVLTPEYLVASHSSAPHILEQISFWSYCVGGVLLQEMFVFPVPVKSEAWRACILLSIHQQIFMEDMYLPGIVRCQDIMMKKICPCLQDSQEVDI